MVIHGENSTVLSKSLADLNESIMRFQSKDSLMCYLSQVSLADLNESIMRFQSKDSLMCYLSQVLQVAYNYYNNSNKRK